MSVNPRPASDAVVRVRGLTRRFGDQLALDGLDLDVFRGECLGFLGPNGAGKSTTVRILATLLAPTSGEVSVLGLDPARRADELRARIGVVPQEIALYEELSARENLAFFARLFGLAGDTLRAAVGRGLDLAGLTDRADDRVQTFSGGMKRRLNIAVALLHGPELVFLDEPTVGVDPQSRNRVFAMVEELRAAGTTLIYTSHQLGEVERLCDRIVILDRGRQVAEGTLAELQRLESVQRKGSARLAFGDVAEARRAQELLEGAGIAVQTTEDLPDLEDVFLQLTGRDLRDGGAA